MSEKTTNEILHKWLGKCFHVWKFSDSANGRIYWQCFICDEGCETPGETDASELPTHPNYITDLNAVREAELKAIRVFGRREYIETLEMQSGHSLYSAAIADADTRAAVIVKLIEEANSIQSPEPCGEAATFQKEDL